MARRLVEELECQHGASTCTASGLPLVDAKSTSFPCPTCGYAIGRSRRCRLQGVPYICPECGFQGP
ncbi:MAG: zinc finger domain-containing protein [Candidatus Thalassarchaeaceae archaeon]